MYSSGECGIEASTSTSRRRVDLIDSDSDGDSIDTGSDSDTASDIDAIDEVDTDVDESHENESDPGDSDVAESDAGSSDDEANDDVDSSFADTSFADTSFADTSFADTSEADTSFADTSFADEGHDLGEGITEVGSAGTVEAPSVDGVQSGDDTETDDELPSRMEKRRVEKMITEIKSGVVSIAAILLRRCPVQVG